MFLIGWLSKFLYSDELLTLNFKICKKLTVKSNLNLNASELQLSLNLKYEFPLKF